MDAAVVVSLSIVVQASIVWLATEPRASLLQDRAGSFFFPFVYWFANWLVEWSYLLQSYRRKEWVKGKRWEIWTCCQFFIIVTPENKI